MEDWPFVSIVVPVFNGAATIGDLLVSLTDLDYPSDRHEVIVVDNGSTDETRNIVGQYPVTLLEERETRGAAAARNKGIKCARSEDIIAFTDADCVVAHDWLRMLVAEHKDQSIGAFAGDVYGHDPARTRVEAVHNHNRILSPFRIETSAGETRKVLARRVPIDPRTALERLWVRLGLITYYKQNPLPALHTAPTANVAYRRAVFEKVGLFDTKLLRAQDPDLAYRMQLHSDYRFHPAPDAIVYHNHKMTLSEVFFHRQRYGLGRVLILDKYSGLTPDVRRQALLESSLNILFGVPYILLALGYRSIRTLVRGKPYPTYLYELLVKCVSDLGNNYGRIKTLIRYEPTSRPASVKSLEESSGKTV